MASGDLERAQAGKHTGGWLLVCTRVAGLVCGGGTRAGHAQLLQNGQPWEEPHQVPGRPPRDRDVEGQAEPPQGGERIRREERHVVQRQILQPRRRPREQRDRRGLQLRCIRVCVVGVLRRRALRAIADGGT